MGGLIMSLSVNLLQIVLVPDARTYREYRKFGLDISYKSCLPCVV